MVSPLVAPPRPPDASPASGHARWALWLWTLPLAWLGLLAFGPLCRAALERALAQQSGATQDDLAVSGSARRGDARVGIALLLVSLALTWVYVLLADIELELQLVEALLATSSAHERKTWTALLSGVALTLAFVVLTPGLAFYPFERLTPRRDGVAHGFLTRYLHAARLGRRDTNARKQMHLAAALLGVALTLPLVLTSLALSYGGAYGWALAALWLASPILGLGLTRALARRYVAARPSGSSDAPPPKGTSWRALQAAVLALCTCWPAAAYRMTQASPAVLGGACEQEQMLHARPLPTRLPATNMTLRAEGAGLLVTNSDEGGAGFIALPNTRPTRPAESVQVRPFGGDLELTICPGVAEGEVAPAGAQVRLALAGYRVDDTLLRRLVGPPRALPLRAIALLCLLGLWAAWSRFAWPRWLRDTDTGGAGESRRGWLYRAHLALLSLSALALTAACVLGA